MVFPKTMIFNKYYKLKSIIASENKYIKASGNDYGIIMIFEETDRKNDYSYKFYNEMDFKNDIETYLKEQNVSIRLDNISIGKMENGKIISISFV